MPAGHVFFVDPLFARTIPIVDGIVRYESPDAFVQAVVQAAARQETAYRTALVVGSPSSIVWARTFPKTMPTICIVFPDSDEVSFGHAIRRELAAIRSDMIMDASQCGYEMCNYKVYGAKAAAAIQNVTPLVYMMYALGKI